MRRRNLIKTDVFENFGIPTISGLLGTGLGACVGGIPGAVALGGLGSRLGLEIGGALFLERQANDLIYRFSRQAQQIIHCSANCLLSGTTVGGFYWLASEAAQNFCNQNSETLSCQSLGMIHVVFVSATALGGTLMIYKASQSLSKKFVARTEFLNDSSSQEETSSRIFHASNPLPINLYRKKELMNSIYYNHQVEQQTTNTEPAVVSTDPRYRFIQTSQGALSESHFVPLSQQNKPYRVFQEVKANYLGLAFVELNSGYFSTNPKLSQSTDVVAWSGVNSTPSYFSLKECQNSLSARLLRQWKIPQTTYVSEEIYNTAEKTIFVYLLSHDDEYLISQVAFNDKMILQQWVHYPSNITKENSPLEHRIASLMHSKPILFHTIKKTEVTFDYPQPIYQNILLENHQIICFVVDERHHLTARLLQDSIKNPFVTETVKEKILPENIIVQKKKTYTLVKFLDVAKKPLNVDLLVKGLMKTSLLSLDKQGNPQLSDAKITKKHEWVSRERTGITSCELVQIKQQNQEEDLYLKIENIDTRTLSMIKDRWSPRSQSVDSGRRSVALSIEDRIRWFKKPSIRPWVDRSDGSYQIDNFRVGPLSSQLDSRVLITAQRWAITLINYGNSSEGKGLNYGHAALLIEILYQDKLGMLLCHLTGTVGLAQKNIASNNSGKTIVKLLQEETGEKILANVAEESLDPKRLWKGIEGKSSTYPISNEKVKILLQEILYGNRPLFSFFGFSYGVHNCLTWATRLASEVSVEFRRLTPWSIMNYPVYFVQEIRKKTNYMLPLEVEAQGTVGSIVRSEDIQEPKNTQSEDEDFAFLNEPLDPEPTMKERRVRERARERLYGGHSGYSKSLKESCKKTKNYSGDYFHCFKTEL